MGDRANVYVKGYGKGGVYLYTHSAGSKLPLTLQIALQRRVRWSDTQYLPRIIFSEMIKDSINSEYGYGISSTVGDGDDRILVVDPNLQTVHVKGKMAKYTFEEYCNLSEVQLRNLFN